MNRIWTLLGGWLSVCFGFDPFLCQCSARTSFWRPETPEGGSEAPDERSMSSTALPFSPHLATLHTPSPTSSPTWDQRQIWWIFWCLETPVRKHVMFCRFCLHTEGLGDAVRLRPLRVVCIGQCDRLLHHIYTTRRSRWIRRRGSRFHAALRGFKWQM